MGYFAALAITLFLAVFVRITIINGGVQMVIYFPCTHGTKSVLSLGTQHYKTQRLTAGHRADADARSSSTVRWTRSPLQPAGRML